MDLWVRPSCCTCMSGNKMSARLGNTLSVATVINGRLQLVRPVGASVVEAMHLSEAIESGCCESCLSSCFRNHGEALVQLT